MRINQFLAAAGLGSRRQCEVLVREGRVQINGKALRALSVQVGPQDQVVVNGKPVQAQTLFTVMFHKPRGFVCTAAPREDEQSVYELLPSDWPRLFSVGRLDKESEGLLILTNDGALSQKLAHPRSKVPKVYEVRVDKPFDFALADRLRKGMRVEGQPARFEAIYRLDLRTLKIVLHQGLKRQIRVMLAAVGYEVKRLVRIQQGGLALGKLPVGRWKVLGREEIARLTQGKSIASHAQETSVEKKQGTVGRAFRRNRRAGNAGV